MPNMSDEQRAEFNESYELAELFPDRINDWERNFMESIRDRIAKYTDATLLSEKQAEVLERINKKLYAIT